MKPTVLIILDGFGIRKERAGNAIKQAKMPFYRRLIKTYPSSVLKASGQYVGLPKGFIGNSIVGHYALGAGRVVDQDQTRIDMEIKSGRFFRNKELIAACNNAKKRKEPLHIMGLISDKGVHSHINHLFAILKLAKKEKVKDVLIHCFLDGRDSPPKSAPKYVRMLKKEMKKQKIGEIASIMGRFYAMDRDNRWNREHAAYDAIVDRRAPLFESAESALKDAYENKERDELVTPRLVKTSVEADVSDGSSVIFFNFRSDRAREITRAFVDKNFRKFSRRRVKNLKFVCITQYDKKIKAAVAFPPIIPKNTLGEYLSNNDFKQLRLAETEKYAHVTYFFNGGKEGPWENEDRILIPSPKVRTYDQAPKLSAGKITKQAVKAIKKRKHNLMVVNFANADMVGHTGDIKATIKGLEFLDKCLSKVITAVENQGYNAIITADHGNCEQMGKGHETAHSTDNVPCIVITEKKRTIKVRPKGSLADVAPTILKLLGMPKPKEMTGKSLI